MRKKTAAAAGSPGPAPLAPSPAVWRGRLLVLLFLVAWSLLSLAIVGFLLFFSPFSRLSFSLFSSLGRLPDDLQGKCVKFFIYDDLPPEANTLLLTLDPSRNASAHEHSTSIFIHQRLEKKKSWWLFNHTVLLQRETQDPSRASLFFVPAYFTTLAKMTKKKGDKRRPFWNQTQRFELITKIMEVPKKKHPWWSRCDGCNHALMFTSGMGPWLFPKSEKVWGNRCPRLMVDVIGFDPNRDVMMPFILPPSLNCSDLNHNKTRHIHFRGSVEQRRSRYALLRRFEKFSRSPPQEGFEGRNLSREILISGERVSEELYWAEMQESVFCLCPEGITPGTRHFSEAVLMGCIPVVVSDAWGSYFPHALGDSSSFTLRHSQRLLHTLFPTLLSIPQETIRDMTEELSRVCKMFSWPDPPEEGDAIHSILEHWVLQSHAAGNRAIIDLAVNQSSCEPP